jgi:beta-glucosidase
VSSSVGPSPQHRHTSRGRVVQLYLHDLVAQIARPVKQLVGFVRVDLSRDETVDVRFRVHADRTSYTNRELERIVEPGDIEVLVGNSSAYLPCRGKIRLIGSTRSSAATGS